MKTKAEDSDRTDRQERLFERLLASIKDSNTINAVDWRGHSNAGSTIEDI